MRNRRASRWQVGPLLVLALVAWLAVHWCTAALAQVDAAAPVIVAAAQREDGAAVRALLARHVNVNQPAADGSTALLWAVYHSDLDMVRALLLAGAAADTANRYGVTPLLQASRTGDAAIMAALLKAGASARQAPADLETPLMAASRTGRLDAVRLLVEAGADVNASDAFQHETALMWSAAEGHVAVVDALLAAGADPNRAARLTTVADRKHADHPTGGLTALMFASRNGHDAVVRALAQGGADLRATNGDGATATIIAIVNDRFDLAKTLLDLGADPDDGSLYFAVDMHDATIDMRARDGSRLRADHPNTLTALDLVGLLLDRGASPNKPFIGQLQSTTLCCSEEINATPFFRAAVAADVEALTLMIGKGAQVEWSPTELKKDQDKDKDSATPARGNPNVGKTPVMLAMVGGRGAAFAAGPGFERLGPPPFREPSNREPVDAVKALLAAGANPNVKAPDGSTPLHQAVTARQVAIVRALVAAGARLDAVNQDNLTPLQLAEKPDPPPPPGNNTDARTWKPHRDSREEVIAALRELMGLGPNDPTPQPPPAAPKPDAQKASEGAR
jgi:ankyrin repeat protein